MKNSLTWILTNDGGLSIIANGRHYTVMNSHQNFNAIKGAIKSDDVDLLISLIDIQRKVQEYVQKTPMPEGFHVNVKNGCLYVNDYVIDNELSRRTQQLMAAGLPFEHMVLFLQNVLQNPSYNSQKQLFRFLTNHKLPITSDGHFLAYKGVRNDWTDCRTGKFNNKPGCINEMPRFAVDDNAASDCSAGFHAGTVEHANSFSSDGHMILVKINPRDVVSVPNSDTTKLRCCRYEVIAGYNGDLTAPIYDAPSNTQPTPVQPSEHITSGTPEAPSYPSCEKSNNVLSRENYEDDEDDEELDEEDEEFDEEDEEDDGTVGEDEEDEELDEEDEEDDDELEYASELPVAQPPDSAPVQYIPPALM